MNNNLFKLLLFFYVCTLAPSCEHTHHLSNESKKVEHDWKEENAIKFLVVDHRAWICAYHQINLAKQTGMKVATNKSDKKNK